MAGTSSRGKPMSRSAHLKVAVIIALAILVSAAAMRPGDVRERGGPRDRQAPTAAHLRVLEAQIVESAPFDLARVAERVVRFRVVTAGAPPCEPGRDAVRYVFVLDAQPWQRGGAVLAAVPELRATARVELACDSLARAFRSSMNGAPVAVSALAAPNGAHVLEAAATVSALPSVEFHWVLLALDGASYTRLPESGRTALWRIRERVLR